MKKAVAFLLLSVIFLPILRSQPFAIERLYALSIESNPTLSGYIHCIDYGAGGQLTLIDSNLYQDVFTCHEGVLASGQDCRWYEYAYSPSFPGKHVLIHTHFGVQAVRGFLYNSTCIYLCRNAPFLRLYDYSGGQITLDSTAIPSGFTDALAKDDRFYVLYPDELRIVDLTNLSLPVCVLPTPKPFPFGGVNTWLLSLTDTNYNEHIYIDIEYQTALMRCSLIELDPVSLSFDSLFHYDIFSNYFRPLPAQGQLYMVNFDTHYDPVADSVIFTSNPNQPVYAAVGYMGTVNGTPPGRFRLHRPDRQKVYSLELPGPILDSVYLGFDANRFQYLSDIIITGRNDGWEVDDPLRILREPQGWAVIMKEVDMEIRNIDVYDFAGRSIQYSCSGLPSREVRLKLQSGPMACIIVVETDGGVFSRKLPFQP